MKKVSILIIGFFFICSCSVDKKIVITEKRKTKKLTLLIDPTIKRGGIGVIIIIPFEIALGIGERMEDIMVYDSSDSLLWELKYVPGNRGLAVRYGKHNPKQYTQIYPKVSKPKDLIRGEIYSVVIKTKKGIYNKRFIFQEAELKITDNDKIKN